MCRFCEKGGYLMPEVKHGEKGTIIARKDDSLGTTLVLLIIFIGLAYMFYCAWGYADPTRLLP